MFKNRLIRKHAWLKKQFLIALFEDLFHREILLADPEDGDIDRFIE